MRTLTNIWQVSTTARRGHTSGRSAFVLAIGGLLAVVFGLGSVVLPAWAVVAVLALPAFITLAAFRPEYGLLVIVLLMTGLVPSALLPRIGLLGGQVSASDLFLLFLFPLALIRGHGSLLAALRRHRLLAALGLTLLLSVTASLIYSLGYAGTERKAVLAEFRILAHWVVLPIALASLHEPERRHRFLKVLVCIGLAVAAGQMMQAMLGWQVFEGSRLEVTETMGRKFSGAMRSIAPGIMVLIFTLLFSLAMFLERGRWRMLWLGCVALLSVGLLFTYGRTLWGITLLGVVVLGLVQSWRRLLPLAFGVALAGVLTLVLLAAVKPVVIEALVDRATSVGSELDHGGSFQWRRIENRYALAALASRPILGVGLGGDYKPVISADLLPEQTRHIHNGYLYLALKLGLPAAFVVLAVILAMAIQSLFALRRQRPSGLAGATLNAAAAFAILPFVSGITRPEAMTPATIVMLALALALLGLGLGPQRSTRQATARGQFR